MKCPQCGAEMEQGYVNAPMTGIAWLSSPTIRWFFSRGVELLQRDWFGPWPPYKAAFSAERCRNCWLVCFWHYQRGIPTASAATDTPTSPSVLDQLRHPSAAIVPCVGACGFAILFLWAAICLPHNSRVSTTGYLCSSGFLALYALAMLRRFLTRARDLPKK
jgi:hypothetical protein